MTVYEAHMSSPYKQDVFAAINLTNFLYISAGAFFEQLMDWICDQFDLPNYQYVRGRPLLGVFNSADLVSVWDQVINGFISRGKHPYIMVTDNDATAAIAINADNIGAYSPAAGAIGHHPYERLFFTACFQVWDRTGSRTRYKPGTSITLLSNQRPRKGAACAFVDEPSVVETILTLDRALERNPDVAYIVAWNELDEEGPGIIPTTENSDKYLQCIAASNWVGNAVGLIYDELNAYIGTDNVVGSPTPIIVDSGPGTWTWMGPTSANVAGNVVPGAHANDEMWSTGDVSKTLTLSNFSGDVYIFCGTGPDRGIVEVLLDGLSLGLFDTYSISTTHHQIICTIPSVFGSHSITVRATNTKNASSSATTIAFDSYGYWAST